MAFGRQVDKQLIGGWPPQGEIRVKDTAQILKLNLPAAGARLLALTLGLGQGPQLVAEGEALGVEHQRAQIEGPAGWGQGQATPLGHSRQQFLQGLRLELARF